jgi:hypothetical protein
LLIPPSTPSLPYPNLPENVDDNCILPHEILYQPDGTTTLLTGFRVGIDIYTTMNGVVSVDIAYGIGTLPWTDQRMLLRDAMLAAKGILDRLPPELQLTTPEEATNGFGGLYDANLQYFPPGYPNNQLANDVRNVIKADPSRRRQLQYEIQKANIFVSQLATRSYFVELYFNLRDLHLTEAQARKESNGETDEADKAIEEPDPAEEDRVYELMTAEREQIVQNLLTVLGTISQRNMEPNGGSLINKIRQVASTLLNDAPERKGPFAVKAEEALAKLIDVLIKLEKTGPGIAGEAESMTAQDEEEELRHWADLREYQAKFAAHGGFAGNM